MYETSTPNEGEDMGTGYGNGYGTSEENMGTGCKKGCKNETHQNPENNLTNGRQAVRNSKSGLSSKPHFLEWAPYRRGASENRLSTIRSYLTNEPVESFAKAFSLSGWE